MTAAPPARAWPVAVRRARPDDREAVLGFASATWDGWDYIPRVWDAWVTAPDGVLLVAVPIPDAGTPPPAGTDGIALPPDRPVAMTRLAMLSPDEAWVEGIRVDPRVRGLSIATDLQVAELHWAVAHGARVVRYATGERNVGSQRLGARHGFEVVARRRMYGPGDHTGSGERTPPEATGEWIFEEFERRGYLVTPGETQAWWKRLSTDATFLDGQRLYEVRPWAFAELTAGVLQEHARAGEVVAVLQDDGSWTLVVVDRAATLGTGRLAIRLLAGNLSVFLGIVDWLSPRGAQPAAVRLPDPERPVPADSASMLAMAGYPAHDGTLLILERPIDPDHPIPTLAGAPGLRLGEAPQRVAEPPSPALAPSPR